MIPVGTDPVGCGAIFEIRETQHPSHPVNQYGNNGPVKAATLAFPTENGGQPIHLSSLSSIGSDTQPLDRQNAHWVPASSNSYAMPTENNEMDLSPDALPDQPSPATTTSNTRSQSLSNGNASGSHSSYSPGQPTDQIPYRPSPRMENQAVPNSIPNSNPPSSTLDNMFYSTNNDILNANYGFGDTTGSIPPIVSDVDYNMGIVSGDWGGMGGLGGLGMGDGSGMTPMSEGAWNQMLESMNMGWESVGPPHGGGRAEFAYRRDN